MIFFVEKRSIKIFVNKILHLKLINNKKQWLKQNTDEFKYVGDTRTSDVEEIQNETEDCDVGSSVLLFPEFINIVSILLYNFIEFIKLHTFLLISFAWYKEYIILCISLIRFSNVLPAFTSASAISNLCLGLNILRRTAKSEGGEQSENLALQATQANILGIPFP